MKPLNWLNTHIYKKGFRATSHLVLLLTTTGRKTGLARVTPLQYEELEGEYLIASARGPEADWFLNIVTDPNVIVQVGDDCFPALGEPITDPARIADFLELRLQRRPRMIKAMLRIEGLPADFGRAELEKFAEGKALVAIRPC